MIRARYWYKVPSEAVLGALPLLLWRPALERTAAAETAALMVYVALVFSSEYEDWPEMLTAQVSATTYDDLHVATGLSRKLLSAGLIRLKELGLIEPSGSHQKRCYRINWAGVSGAWFKLPCRAILREQKIMPFYNFTLRSKHELHAMKLYLYLAARRRNELEESFASYEKINASIGIPEKDIRKAISVLIATGLLRSVNRTNDDDQVYGANQYFLMGCERLRGNSAV